MTYLTEKPLPPDLPGPEENSPALGGRVSFAGIVRGESQGRKVLKLEYVAYPELAEKEIGRLIGRVRAQTGAPDIRVLHRLGWLEPGEAAVRVEARAPHRAAAFRACETMIELLKESVPIWKKEVFADGDGEWVEPH